MVNTYSKEINGQTNHKNNQLNCNENICELTLGDGSRRINEKVQSLPSLLLGEEMIPLMAAQMIEADYFILVQEILPSGNQLFFSYDQNGHLIAIEMKNSLSNKSLSWIHFSYEFKEKGCRVHIETSDARELNYDFTINSGDYQLTQVSGSHCTPISYDYKGVLTRKNLAEGRFLEVEYQDGKVAALKRPNAQSGKKEVMYSFSYGKNYTDVFDAVGIKTRYLYDMRFQLQTIERYDHENNLYRTESKFWGNNELEAGILLAKTIGDGKKIYSYRSFQEEKRHYMSSGEAGIVVRSHWSIENHLHWTMDVIFRENESLANTGHAGENLAMFKRMALTLIKEEIGGSTGIAAKRREAAWDDSCGVRIIGQLFRGVKSF